MGGPSDRPAASFRDSSALACAQPAPLPSCPQQGFGGDPDGLAREPAASRAAAGTCQGRGAPSGFAVLVLCVCVS